LRPLPELRIFIPRLLKPGKKNSAANRNLRLANCCFASLRSKIDNESGTIRFSETLSNSGNTSCHIAIHKIAFC
jgi:hypothetical protein